MKTPIKIIGGAISLLIIYTIGIYLFTPDFITKEVEVVVEKEITVEIDSSAVYREYSERIPEPKQDTVFVEIEVPKPVPISSGMNEYRLVYADSLISALWTTTVQGTLTSQDFEYFTKRRLVKETVWTFNRTVTNTINTTKTITKVENPKPYFTVGAEFTDLDYLSVSGGFMTRNRYHFYYNYNTHFETHSIGFSMPLTFKLRRLL